MRKLTLLTATIVALMVGVGRTETLMVPQNQSGFPLSPDYGVTYSTIAFSSANVLLIGDEPGNVATKGGSIVGFIASSYTFAAPLDFILFRDTGSILNQPENASGLGGDYQTNNEICRVYLASTSVATNGTALQLGQSYKLPQPIRVKRGLTAKASTALLNMVTFIYTKYGQ